MNQRFIFILGNCGLISLQFFDHLLVFKNQFEKSGTYLKLQKIVYEKKQFSTDIILQTSLICTSKNGGNNETNFTFLSLEELRTEILHYVGPAHKRNSRVRHSKVIPGTIFAKR